MAKSLDDLVDFLLDEIALDSGRGKSNISSKWDVVNAPIFGFRFAGSVVGRLLDSPQLSTLNHREALKSTLTTLLIFSLLFYAVYCTSSDVLVFQVPHSRTLSATREISMHNRTMTLHLHRLRFALPVLSSIKPLSVRSGNGW